MVEPVSFKKIQKAGPGKALACRLNLAIDCGGEDSQGSVCAQAHGDLPTLGIGYTEMAVLFLF